MARNLLLHQLANAHFTYLLQNGKIPLYLSGPGANRVVITVTNLCQSISPVPTHDDHSSVSLSTINTINLGICEALIIKNLAMLCVPVRFQWWLCHLTQNTTRRSWRSWLPGNNGTMIVHYVRQSKQSWWHHPCVVCELQRKKRKPAFWWCEGG